MLRSVDKEYLHVQMTLNERSELSTIILSQRGPYVTGTDFFIRQS